MRVRSARTAAALALTGLLALSADAPAHPRGAVRAVASSTGLQVSEVEYRLLLSHSTVTAGAVNLEALDRGRIPHDLRLRANGSSQETKAPQLKPGEHWNAVVHLKPGVYRLWCSLPQHARLGMHTTLTVVR